MLAKRAQTFEFLGGPMDGWVSECQEPPKPFALVRSTPPVADAPALSQLMRPFLQGHSQPGIVAVYELDRGTIRTAYRYLRSTIATDLEVSELIWVVDALSC